MRHRTAQRIGMRVLRHAVAAGVGRLGNLLGTQVDVGRSRLRHAAHASSARVGTAAAAVDRRGARAAGVGEGPGRAQGQGLRGRGVLPQGGLACRTAGPGPGFQGRQRPCAQEGPGPLQWPGRGAELAAAKGTAWGLLNVVTEFVDHERRARSQEYRLGSAWFGQGATIKQRALDQALALAA